MAKKFSDYNPATAFDGILLQEKGSTSETVNFDLIVQALIEAGFAPSGFDQSFSPISRATMEFTTSIGGGNQGAAQLTSGRPLQVAKVNAMVTYCAQGYGGSIGRMGLYQKDIGGSSFGIIGQTPELSFETSGLRFDGLGETYFLNIEEYFTCLAATGDPQFLSYTGVNVNAPEQISHERNNLWNLPLTDTSLPEELTGGSSSNRRFWCAAYFDPALEV